MKKVIFTQLVLLVSVFASFGQWQTEGSDIYFNSGKVGLGTSSPATDIHLKKYRDGELTFLIQNTFGNGTAMYLAARPDNATIQTTSNFGIWTHNNSWSEKFTVANNGNIGIGTTNPTSKLEVSGKVKAEKFQGLVFGEYPDSKFNYDQLDWGHYSLGWTRDSSTPGSAALWMSGYGGIKFFTHGEHRMAINAAGDVGIGTTSPTAKLTVAGDILAREIRVEANAGADFVFEENYPLKPLKEVEQFIAENKHLPNIASADTMIQNGVNMGEFQIQLLQKIEELTLYVIKQEKENEEMKKQLEMQQKRMEELEMKVK